MKRDRLLGIKPDRSDCAFQIEGTGDPGYVRSIKSKYTDPHAKRVEIFNNKITKGIWTESVNYEDYVGDQHWMDATFVVPIIVYKYQLDRCVVYTMGGGNFMTSTFRYESVSDCVFVQEDIGLDTNAGKGGLNLLYFHAQKHFQIHKCF